MITIHCRPRHELTRAEREMVAAMRDLPGVLVVGALVSNGRRTRELDGVWVHPAGLSVIEVKGTRMRGTLEPSANSPWTIDGETADFAGGPNPTVQARVGAQVLKGALGHQWPHWVTPVLAVAGEVRLRAQRVADVTVCEVAHLSQLQDRTPAQLGVEDVLHVLGRLELSGTDLPGPEELDAEGFVHVVARADAPAPPPAPVPAAAGANGRERRRARRLAELEAQARQSWHRAHVRRVVSSALAGAVLVGVLPRLPWYCTVVGTCTGIGVGLHQLWLRRTRSGPRHSGSAAMALWLLSLLPVAGIGATLSWAAALPVLDALQWPFVLTLAILLACGMACGILAGRSAYAHPPEMVLERFDESGRATGAFTLAGTRRDQWPAGDWRPVTGPVPADPARRL